MDHRYAIGLGANLYGNGPPARTIDRVLAALEDRNVAILARSKTIASRPLGPGRRDYANAAALVEAALAPPALLALIASLERTFGRRRNRRWGDRMLDIDILLWSGGMWADRMLAIPHRAFRERTFVLDPLSEIAADWRDPVTGLSVRQLRHRLHANSPVDRTGPRP